MVRPGRSRAYRLGESRFHSGFLPSPHQASDELKQFYALGAHCGEVHNGGHGQFVYNLSVGQRWWILEACKLGAHRLYPADYAITLSELYDWFHRNRTAITSPEGYEFSEDETILRLNDAFDVADESSDAALIRVLGNTPDGFEKSYVQSVVNQTASSFSHLDAFRTLWLKRSGLLRSMSEDDYESLISTLRQPTA